MHANELTITIIEGETVGYAITTPRGYTTAVVEQDALIQWISDPVPDWTIDEDGFRPLTQDEKVREARNQAAEWLDSNRS